MKPAFNYINGHLCLGARSLKEVAACTGSPVWIYDKQIVIDRLDRYRSGLGPFEQGIRYAVKANDNHAILRAIAQNGAGADIVSGGELRKCLAAGFDPTSILFSGVGKVADEIDLAIQTGIEAIHLESSEELSMVEARARVLGKKVKVGIRLNPDVAVSTHAHTATGTLQHKFGVPFDEAVGMFGRLRDSEYLCPRGLAFHLGSQITDSSRIYTVLERVIEFANDLRPVIGSLEYIDAGGGLAVKYAPDEVVPAIEDHTRGLAQRIAGCVYRLLIEPGRSIVAEAGVLLTSVIYCKENPLRKFVIIDAAMNDLLRPSLYAARHPILPVSLDDGPQEQVDVVGPVCETGDFLGRNVLLPRLQPGDLIAIGCVGAYGRVMSSNYNCRGRAAEWMLDNGELYLVRRAESFDDLARYDCDVLYEPGIVTNS
jgi:diaminopimelate decarboxylase